MTLDRPAAARRVGPVFVAVVLAVLIGPVAGAQGQDGGASPDPAVPVPPPFPAESIVAPGTSPLDLSYADWAGQWFAWLLGAPATDSPMLLDACAYGQGGTAYLIPQAAPGTTLATRCETYGDQFLLLASGMAWCDTLADPGATDEALAACVEEERAAQGATFVTIDGQLVEDLDAYWVVTSPLDIPLPEDDVLGADSSAVHGVGGGAFLMIQPLAPGPHPVIIHDEAVDAAGEVVVTELQAEVDVVP